MKLRVTYSRPQDVVADNDQQFARGGLFVTVEADDGIDRGSPVELHIVAPTGDVTVDAKVIQVMAGAGIAVGFDPNLPALDKIVAEARMVGEADGDPPRHEIVGDDDGDGDGDGDGEKKQWARRAVKNIAETKVDAITRIKSCSTAEKMQIALHGSKDERTIIMRDPNRTLQKYVIRNPHIQLDEVAFIAKNPQVAPDVLKFIASRREWAGRPEVANALVTNPKTPVPLAVKMVPNMSITQARQLAKSANVRVPILKAIRKRIVKR